MGTKAHQRSDRQTRRKQARKHPQDLPLTAYVSAAMRRAKYKKLKDRSWLGKIPACPGVFALSETKNAARRELQSVLEGWIMVGLHSHGEIPAIGKIDLTASGPFPSSSLSESTKAKLRSKLIEMFGTLDISLPREVQIFIEQYKDGYTGSVKGIDGVVVGQGDSEQAALLDTVSALKFHLETLNSTASHTDEDDKSALVSRLEKLISGAIKEVSRAHGKVLPGSIAKRVAAQLWADWNKEMFPSYKLEELMKGMTKENKHGDAWKESGQPLQEAVALIQYVLLRLARTFDEQTARKWLQGINAHLRNNRPIYLLRRGKVSEVIAAIEQLGAGSPA